MRVFLSWRVRGSLEQWENLTALLRNQVGVATVERYLSHEELEEMGEYLDCLRKKRRTAINRSAGLRSKCHWRGPPSILAIARLLP